MDARRVGAPLRAARRARGLGLGEAARELGVPEHFLADLEDGRLEAFGPRAHAVAHLRIYARHLGVELDVMPPGPDDARPLRAAETTTRRRPIFIAAVGLIIVGALIAIVTVLMFDPDQRALDSVIFSEAAEDRILADPAGTDGDGDVADDTGVRAQVLERDPVPTPPEDEDDDGPSPLPDAGAPEPGAATTDPPGPIGEGLRVQILDGSQDSARVAAARAVLEQLGYQIVFVDRAAGTYEQTTVLHAADLADEAETLLAADGRFVTRGPDPGLGAPADLHVIVGLDWPES